MKKKTIVFSILFVFIFQFAAVGLSQSSSSATQIDVQYWDKYTILANQVKINLATQLPQGVFYQIGSPELVRFTPLNSQKISDNEVLYRSEVVVKWELTLATVYNMNDLPKADDSFDIMWGRFFFCERFNRAYDYVFVGNSQTKSTAYDPGNKYWATNLRVKTKPVYMYEPSIRVTSQKLTSQPNFGYAGDIQFNIQFEFDDRVRDYGDTQIVMKRKAFLSRLEQSRIVAVSEYENGQVSQYNEAIAARVTPNAGGQGQSAFEGKINEMNLGVTAGSSNYRTVIEGESVPAPRGSTLQNGTTIRNVKLYPNVLEKKQTVNVRFGSLDIDTQDEIVFGANVDPAGIAHVYGAPTTDTRQRVLGWEIKNKGHLYTIETSFTLEALNEVEVKDNDKPVPLEPINQTRDDYYWDNFIDGTVEISPQRTEEDLTPWATDILNFWKQNWWWIITIIIVVAVLALVIYIKLSVPSLPSINVPEKYRYPR